MLGDAMGASTAHAARDHRPSMDGCSLRGRQYHPDECLPRIPGLNADLLQEIVEGHPFPAFARPIHHLQQDRFTIHESLLVEPGARSPAVVKTMVAGNP